VLAIVKYGFVAAEFVTDLRQFKDTTDRSIGPLEHCGLKAGQLRTFAVSIDQETSGGLEYLKAKSQDPISAKGIRRYGDVVIPLGPFYFYGVVYYVDERGDDLGTEHAAVFRRLWNPDVGAFERTGNSDHEHSD
jgi:hypothetical protein